MSREWYFLADFLKTKQLSEESNELLLLLFCHFWFYSVLIYALGYLFYFCLLSFVPVCSLNNCLCVKC